MHVPMGCMMKFGISMGVSITDPLTIFENGMWTFFQKNTKFGLIWILCAQVDQIKYFLLKNNIITCQHRSIDQFCKIGCILEKFPPKKHPI